jgi:hypothetical protein
MSSPHVRRPAWQHCWREAIGVLASMGVVALTAFATQVYLHIHDADMHQSHAQLAQQLRESYVTRHEWEELECYLQDMRADIRDIRALIGASAYGKSRETGDLARPLKGDSAEGPRAARP